MKEYTKSPLASLDAENNVVQLIMIELLKKIITILQARNALLKEETEDAYSAAESEASDAASSDVGCWNCLQNTQNFQLEGSSMLQFTTANSTPQFIEQETDDQAKIVEVKWMDGDHNDVNAPRVDEATQWVNLPQDTSWVDGQEIKSSDRLGIKPRIWVKFNKPGRHNFKIKLNVRGGTNPYSDTELKRNRNFRYSSSENGFTTNKDGTKIVSNLSLVAGGGYNFSAEATDGLNNRVESGIIQTNRIVYYANAVMQGLSSQINDMVNIESEYKSHFIKLVKLPNLIIPRQQNIGSRAELRSLEKNLGKSVEESHQHQKLKDHLLINAFTDHLAVKNSNVKLLSTPKIKVGSGENNIRIAVSAAGLRKPFTVKPRSLWFNIISGEDWFVSGKFITENSRSIEIKKSDCRLIGSGSNFREIEVDVQGLSKSTGQIELTVNVIDRMRGGLALGGANMTCVCTKSWWTNMSKQKQENVFIHEFGHKFQQVSSGSSLQPDRAAKHYLDKGHVGDHCFQGCPAGEPSYATTGNLNLSQCVMFGSVNQKRHFCSDCAPAVKKVDLMRGW